MPDDLQLTPHFRLSEFKCPCCGGYFLEDLRRLAARLEVARIEAGPMVIVSGHRCPKHNLAVHGVPNSQHLTGLAADILVTGDGHRFQLLKALVDSGFKRIGIGKDIIHADLGNVPGSVIWTYYA